MEIENRLRLWDGPYFAPESRDYLVEIEGRRAFVHAVTVSSKPTNELWRGVQRAESETEQASLVNFDFTGTVRLRVVCAWEVFCARVLPEQKGVVPKRGSANKGDEVSFTITEPGQYVLEVNGLHCPLHIFANPMEEDAPDPSDPRVEYRAASEKQDFPGYFTGRPLTLSEGKEVLYFGPGIHHADLIQLKSGQSVYIHGGAVVYAAVFAQDARNVRVWGRGILDGSRFHRDASSKSLATILHFDQCENVKVEGVILRDASVYNLTTTGGRGIEVSNVKIISWRRNSDGMDFHNTSDIHLHDSFLRCFDDAVVLKGQHAYHGCSTRDLPMENVLVERCTIWGDWGRALEFGAETSAPFIRHVVLRDCDVIHFAFIACDIQACGSAPISDVLFEDIRIGDPIDSLIGPRIIEIFIRNMLWMEGEPLGNVRDVTFRNISYRGLVICPIRFIGEGPEHDIRDVRLENIVSGGVKVRDGGHMLSPVICNEFARGISIDGVPLDLSTAHLETEEETKKAFLVGNGAFLVF